MLSNPISAYQQIGFESEVRGADPHRLIMMLFDATEVALRTAKEQIAQKDIPGKSDSINKAIQIILEGLSGSLNVKQGGELAERLQALYMYMVSRLVHANVHLDIAAIEEVENLLGQIAGAWREIRPQITGA
jgi:flagellar secretion chaperone FliS